MERFIINGGKKLSGTIEVKGAKNDALVIFAASLLTAKPVNITNVPEIEDTRRLAELIDKLGAKVEHLGHGKYRITADRLKTHLIDSEVAKKLRASILLTAPLLSRIGKVGFPHPGGCVIGERPINLFIDGYTTLGARVSHKNFLYEITSSGLKGGEIVFDNISVTGTESMIMAACLFKGLTVLKNCACEPEVKSLAGFLNNCGAKITGAGTPNIIVEGVKNLSGGKHETIPDRIEAGSLAILALASGSNMKIDKCKPGHLDILWNLLKKAGAVIKINKDSVEIKPSKLKSFSVKTHEYPGFPTDLQAPLCVLLTQAEGQALVHETIYEGRLNWTEELRRMGADILNLDPHRIEIKGPTQLRGRDIESPDIRAGMAYIIAALCAEGESVVNNVYQIDRGYEKIEERLQKIGADIRRV